MTDLALGKDSRVVNARGIVACFMKYMQDIEKNCSIYMESTCQKVNKNIPKTTKGRRVEWKKILQQLFKPFLMNWKDLYQVKLSLEIRFI